MVKFEWFGPNELPISGNNEMNIITRLNESVLQFSALKQSHNGTYKCRVTIGSTSNNQTRTVSVLGKWIIVLMDLIQ